MSESNYDPYVRPSERKREVEPDDIAEQQARRSLHMRTYMHRLLAVFFGGAGVGALVGIVMILSAVYGDSFVTGPGSGILAIAGAVSIPLIAGFAFAMVHISWRCARSSVFQSQGVNESFCRRTNLIAYSYLLLIGLVVLPACFALLQRKF